MDEGWTSWKSWKTWKTPMENDGFAMEKLGMGIGLNIDRQNWDVEGQMDSVRSSAEEGKERNAIAEFTHFSAGFNKDDGYIIEAGFFWCRNSRHVFLWLNDDE
jgi:hypothetical protein